MTRLRSLPWRRILLLSIVPLALLFKIRAVRYDQRRTIKEVGNVTYMAFVDRERKLITLRDWTLITQWDVAQREGLKGEIIGSGSPFEKVPLGHMIQPSFIKESREFVFFYDNLDIWDSLRLKRKRTIIWNPSSNSPYKRPPIEADNYIWGGHDWSGKVLPDGRRLVIVVNFERELINRFFCLDVKTWKLLWQQDINAGHPYRVNGARIDSLEYAPDSSTMIAGSSGAIGHVIDMKTGGVKFVTSDFGNNAISTFSPDSVLLATATSFMSERKSRTVRVQQKATGALVQVIANEEDVTALCFAPNSQILAIGDSAGGIGLWDITTGKHQSQLRSHRGRITALAFSPDGKTLASASMDGTIKFWDLSP